MDSLFFDDDEGQDANQLQYATSGRARCKGRQPCNGTLIEQGVLRLGTLVNFGDYGPGMQWRHAGCITAKQFQNLHDTYSSVDCIPGFEDLDKEDKYMLQRAWDRGDLAQEDMEPLNPSYQKHDYGPPKVNDTVTSGEHTGPSKEVGSDDEYQAPKPRAKRAIKKVGNEVAPFDEDEDEEESQPAPKKKKKRAPARKAPVKTPASTSTYEVPPVKGKRRTRAQAKAEEAFIASSAAAVPGSEEGEEKKPSIPSSPVGRKRYYEVDEDGEEEKGEKKPKVEDGEEEEEQKPKVEEEETETGGRRSKKVKDEDEDATVDDE